MKRTSIIILLALVQTVCCSAQISKIIGDWVTVDDKTGQNYAVVSIYRADDGKYYGKITKMLIPGTENEKCIECTGEDKDKPVLGMVIIRAMTEKDGALVGGKVLDPENGKFYYGRISYDNGRLKLRGSLDKAGILGRSQYWDRKK
ncbi:MAG: DUF2147 domain-containing protein [Paludibacteraceae bacterium]|nr:DUF2147 domain-containing protein [Paludibacteraceae bacterium]